HARLMVEHFDYQELKAMRELRKHMSWYLKGYSVGGEVRRQLGLVSSLAELDERLAELDLSEPYPGAAAEGPRGRAGTPKKPHVPEGWLDSRTLDESWREMLLEAESSVSGG
ncbi:MAG TPA: tRNA dihydrouridine synthase DusB, partial [Ruania sp.]|nr:tRNA dihydrouridine synthase DusB [Ruania sp.]